MRGRLREGAFLAGTFVKTPATEIIECLARAGLDFICLDAEHAAWDRRSLDQCLGLARVLGLPALVRIPALAPDAILQVLDGGAEGIVAPHVKTRADAENLVRWANYGPEGRGYSGSTRSAGLRGLSMGEVLAQPAPLLIPQIEDASALPNVAEIASVPGIDVLFLGAADLAVSLGATSTGADVVTDALTSIRSVARETGTAVAAFVASPSGLHAARQEGTQLAFVSSDQSLLIDVANSISIHKN